LFPANSASATQKHHHRPHRRRTWLHRGHFGQGCSSCAIRSRNMPACTHGEREVLIIRSFSRRRARGAGGLSSWSGTRPRGHSTSIIHYIVKHAQVEWRSFSHDFWGSVLPPIDQDQIYTSSVRKPQLRLNVYRIHSFHHAIKHRSKQASKQASESLTVLPNDKSFTHLQASTQTPPHGSRYALLYSAFTARRAPRRYPCGGA
jgi:hypothetical protein